MPWMSSGVVSQRTRITGPAFAALDGGVGVEARSPPQAAPGEAFRPLRGDLERRLGSIIGWSSWSSWAGSIRATASSREISPSSTIVDGRLERRRGRALRGARLQQVELLVLDGELDVLHVAVVLLEAAHRLEQLLERLGQRVAHRLERLRRADARDDVLALRVREELAVDAGLAGRRDRG